MTNLIPNHSFEFGWDDIVVNSTRNHKPYFWNIEWLLPGQDLLSKIEYTGEDEAPRFTQAVVIPECVIKESRYLPPNEQTGGENALILDGLQCYKVFASQPFSATLKQSITTTQNKHVKLTVPIQVHSHGDGTVGAAVFKIKCNGVSSKWFTFGDFEDRAWFYPSIVSQSDNYGNIAIEIIMEGRAFHIDFFLDNLTLEYVEIPDNEGKPREQYPRKYYVLPQNSTLRKPEKHDLQLDGLMMMLVLVR